MNIATCSTIDQVKLASCACLASCLDAKLNKLDGHWWTKFTLIIIKHRAGALQTLEVKGQQETMEVDERPVGSLVPSPHSQFFNVAC